MIKHLISYYIGIFVIFASHLYMLTTGSSIEHSIVNIIAGLMIAYYFMNKENIISF